MKQLGWAIDWQREVAAHQPEYYRWTQWLFLQFVERGLAYRKEAPVNWCPNDQTVIANEYVVDGHCERCGAEVELRNMTQWFIRITAYADELREYDLPEGGWWPERSKTIQRNWIGRSEGAEILFRVEELDIDLPCSRRVRTPCLVRRSSSSHPSIRSSSSTATRRRALRAHAGGGRSRTARRRSEKTGIFTGLHASTRSTARSCPIWVADYVLMHYGTGASWPCPRTTSATASSRRPSACPSSR